MSDSYFPTLDWSAIIADAVERIEWVQADPTRTIQQAGDGPAIEDAPAVPEPVRRARRQAITRERMGRWLGCRKGQRWAGREKGAPVGTFSPAEITPQQAAAMLVIVRRYVTRWSGPYDARPLSPDGVDETVSAIVHHIWTRDYTDAGIGAGNLAAAVWQACSLYRRSRWVGIASDAQRASKARKRQIVDAEQVAGLSRGGVDNPARIVAAMEAAERGLAAPVVENRGRQRTHRGRGVKRMPAVSAADARQALLGE